MKPKSCLKSILPAIGMIVLILDTKTALKGASEGLSLCFQALIPSLMPFIFLSILLTNSLLGKTGPVLSRLAGLCHMAKGTQSLLLIGLLGGYPVGAQNIGTCYSTGQLKKTQAERMLAFCNNAGPAYLFGVIGSAFSKPVYPWLLWGIHIVSALLVGAVYPWGGSEEADIKSSPIGIASAMQLTVKATASVCGWVILFRTLLSFLDRWVIWAFPIPAQVMISGALELANGCVQLGRIPVESTRFLAASSMLAFGGFCVAMQTVSVTGGLSCRHYCIGKGLQTCFSVLLSVIACKLLMPDSPYRIPLWADGAMLTGLVFLLILNSKRKIEVAFPPVLVYNEKKTSRGGKHAFSQEN